MLCSWNVFFLKLFYPFPQSLLLFSLILSPISFALFLLHPSLSLFFPTSLSFLFAIILFLPHSICLPFPSPIYLLICNLLSLSPDYLHPFYSSFSLTLSLSIIYLSLAGFILLYTSLSPPPFRSLPLSALPFFPHIFSSYLHPSLPLIMSPPYFSSLAPSQMTISYLLPYDWIDNVLVVHMLATFLKSYCGPLEPKDRIIMTNSIIYTIICLKSVVVRKLQVAILARSRLKAYPVTSSRLSSANFFIREKNQTIVAACCLLRSALRPDKQLNSKPQNRANWVSSR